MPPEAELRRWLHAASEGDQNAFTIILRHYWVKVYTQAITYLKSAELAQEVTQDVFMKIWAGRDRLPGIENFSGYLFIVARNELISALRKKKDSTTGFTDNLEETLLRPDKQLQYKEFHQRILGLIDKLPPVRKKVFTMSRLEGKSYEEIALELDISRNGVKDHIVRALNFLRSNLVLHEEKLLVLIAATQILFQ
ncbi:putative RNA polymerase ECF-type sigma factor [Flavihumibacter petaseus NBRC 106054]|uniref:Putative RNA polymerase ECF-type sigma factor n=2 Tax=Flavihumibacter TaxID=1004301 RepID=A0A0E9MZ49_9BACT|nr:putative RNA polymerase ECF-type sigma factor [Flavihumibacter petaseus NBRC 106054]